MGAIRWGGLTGAGMELEREQRTGSDPVDR